MWINVCILCSTYINGGLEVEERHTVQFMAAGPQNSGGVVAQTKNCLVCLLQISLIHSKKEKFLFILYEAKIDCKSQALK